MRTDPTPTSRRTFLQLAGASVLAFLATVRAYADAAPSQQEEVPMEITWVGSQSSARGPAELAEVDLLAVDDDKGQILRLVVAVFRDVDWARHGCRLPELETLR
jgi:hypothetical protein